MKKLKLDVKFDVAGIKYEVSEVDGMIRKDERMGLILYPEAKIMIDSGMSKEKKTQVLIRELTHAIFNESGYEEQDEDMVNRLSITLYQFLKNNKELLKEVL